MIQFVKSFVSVKFLFHIILYFQSLQDIQQRILKCLPRFHQQDRSGPRTTRWLVFLEKNYYRLVIICLLNVYDGVVCAYSDLSVGISGEKLLSSCDRLSHELRSRSRLRDLLLSLRSQDLDQHLSLERERWHHLCLWRSLER